jgi:hypothetical protein
MALGMYSSPAVWAMQKEREIRILLSHIEDTKNSRNMPY